MILPICPALVRAHLEYCTHACGPQHKQDTDLLNRGLERFVYEERFSKLGLFILERGRLQRNLIAAFQKGAQEKDEDFLPGPVVTGQVAMVLNQKIDLDWA